jgi:O-methyltransferase involved in polyketide biosynthesis
MRDDRTEVPAVNDDLAVVRADFPAYQIWREEGRDQPRYVARSRVWRLNPHTVVTPDLAELRDALSPAHSAVGDSLASTGPNIARMYDYWLDGKDHFAADRAAADAVLREFPEVAEIAHANRAFLARAVRYVARKGVGQFLDLGAGLPASPNVHETARAVNPDARVVYLDRDPVVLAHARALLAVDDKVSVVGADIRDHDGLLTDELLTARIDCAAPVCVLLVSVLHFLTAAEADAVVAAFREWMPPGSYLVISAGTSTGTDPELIRHLQDAYGDTAPVSGRTASEIRAWFHGITLARPGLVDVWAWRPDTSQRPASARARFLAGVGRKMPDRPRWQA